MCDYTKSKKRTRFDDDDDYDIRRRHKASSFFDEEAEVDTDDELEEEDEHVEEGFIVDSENALPEEEDDSRRRPRHRLPPSHQEDDEYLEAVERTIRERYRKQRLPDYDQQTTHVQQQALLPSVMDPKLWMLKCAIGRERETALCLMQNYIDKGSKLQIRSAIALDHIKNYIYVEADKEAHVREACKGLRNMFGQKITLVPITEMTDVLSVQSRGIDLARDTWVRMKIVAYKGDLAKVVDVDNVRQKVTVELIPRIDFKALANKLEGREVVKKKAFVPPPRFMNVDEARKLHIRVEHKRDAYGEWFDSIGGMMFKDGFLYKTVSIKSISAQNIKPTLDELEKFRKPGESRDVASLSTLSANRKKGHFMKGDAVIVVKGDLKNLKGWVEKVYEDNVHIRPGIKGLPKTLAVNEKELVKYFEPGNHVKVVSGVQEGATGMVVKVEQHVLILISDTTKEHIRVFADDVVESSEVTTGVTIPLQGDAYGRFSGLKNPPRIPQSPKTFSAGGHPSDSGWRHESLTGAAVKVRQGPYKGYRGRVIKVKGTFVEVELESQMKIVTVDRNHITDNVAVTSQRESSRYGMGSETPMHPSRTPLQPYMTPMRDPGATPIHDGMRTPMPDRAWNPYAPMSPATASIIT